MDMLARALKALDDAGLEINQLMQFTLPTWAAECSSTKRRLPAHWWIAWSVTSGGETVSGPPRASAVKNGLLAIASGYYDSVLVVGGEKMREVTGWRATDFVASMTHPQAEYPYGITLPGMAGMFTRLYMEKYGVTREHLLAISLKNQEMGTLNPYAHVEMALDRNGIFDSPHAIVNNPVSADPLHLYDLCPVSDGAAALVLCTVEVAKKIGKPYVVIAGFGQATDTHTLAEREDPTDLKAVTLAAQKAFVMAKLKPSDKRGKLQRFYHPEIAESEHDWLLQEGRGGKVRRDHLGGQIVNVSGGLKARGHLWDWRGSDRRYRLAIAPKVT